MMVFCKRSVNSFLGMSGMFPEEEKSESCKCGLGLITSESQRPPNVIESSVLKSPNSDRAVEQLKKGPGRVGFIDDMGGQVDGLMSCTESLGFESCEERRFDDGIGMGFSEERKASTSGGGRLRSGCEGWRERKKKFPPPLSSLNQNGRPCFYLRPVRKDGKLELTEVRIDRRETLRVHREGGRLTLHLVSNDPCSDYIEKEEDLQSDSIEIEEEQKLQSNCIEEDEELEPDSIGVDKFQPGKETKLQLEEEEGGEEKNGKNIEENWGYPVSGEGLRRCHELVMSHHRRIQHHHQQLHHVWRQQHCVPTR